MSSIRFSLEKLDSAVGKLDSSVTNVEKALQEYVPMDELQAQLAEQAQSLELRDGSGNVIDVDFVAKRLDKAISTVENLLSDED
ncbi:MAG: hypothetical protein COB14_08515 [Alphaproteobacteria bacterium]|nr:MAG: hypothetical protein COB14_08515 [Alphaproteobacteria bacterium]